MKKTELIKAAKELNKELGLDPEIEVKKVETDYLIGKLKEAAGMAVKEEDDLSDETWAVLEAMKEDPPEDADGEADKEKGTAKDLPAILAETKKLADLKALVEDNDEFKTLRKGLDKYKGLQGPRELRPVMEECLGIKPDGKKTAEKSAGKKNVTVDRIAFLAPLIEKGKFTKKQLMEKAQKKFPQATDGALQTLLSDGKNPKYNKFADLIVQDDDKCLSFE